MTAIRNISVPLLCCGLAVALLAGCEAARKSSLREPLGEPAHMTRTDAMWGSATALEVRTRDGRTMDSWRYNLATDGVVHVAFGGAAGEMMLVGGKILLARDVMFAAGQELETFDDAMLDQQLALRLLEAAFPQGPHAIQGTLTVLAEDNGQPLRTETTNTTRVYFPPWSVRARVTRTSPDVLSYTLSFDGQSSGKRVSLEIDGQLNQSGAAPLPDDYPLLGWNAYRLRVGTRQSAGLTVAGWVAGPESRRYRTLGEARAVAGQIR